MSTRDELIAQYHADPQYATLTRKVGKETIPLTKQERSALFGEWADNTLATQEREAKRAAEQETREEARDALPALQADTARLADGKALPQDELHAIVLRLCRTQERIIRTLVAAGIIEADDAREIRHT